MRTPETCTYSGYLYLDGKFVGEREEKLGRGVSTLRKRFARIETLLRAFSQGFPGKLIVELEMNCPEGRSLFPTAWRDYPYEAIRLTKTIDRLPAGLRSRLLKLQQESLAAELGD